VPGLDIPWQPHVTVGLAADLTRSDLMMDRRTATCAITAAAVTGAALLDPLEAWLQPPDRHAGRRRPGRLGQRDVTQLEQTAQVFRRWDHQYGGGLRRKAVLGQLNEVAAALDEHQAPIIEKHLYRIMAYLAGTAATMAWDCGLHRRSQDYYRLALRASHAGGDRVFGANVLAGMARQMLEYRGQPQDALELVRLAQYGARDEAGPRVRAMLRTREAWALAAMGRTAAFRRATEQAREELAADGDGEEPYWIAYFDEAELAGGTGGRLVDLARRDPRRHAEEASEEIGRALAQRGVEASRSHALDRINLAECHFLMGDTGTAAQYAHDAVDAVEHTQSGRVRERLADLYGYTVGQSASGAVRETRDRIREVLAS
jgi:hypothetical protein